MISLCNKISIQEQGQLTNDINENKVEIMANEIMLALD